MGNGRIPGPFRAAGPIFRGDEVAIVSRDVVLAVNPDCVHRDDRTGKRVCDADFRIGTSLSLRRRCAPGTSPLPVG